MITIHEPVSFDGDTESSKTATILSYIRNFDSQYTNLTLNFSSRTKSIDVQRSKNTYGSTAGTKNKKIVKRTDSFLCCTWNRIIQSLLQTIPERFLRVWLHECIRIFSNRCNDIKDNELFNKILQNIIDNNFLLKFHRNYLFRKSILFSDYRTILQNDEPKIYEDL
ncbi:unnamed protein product, partial [Rotaria sp. Silwood2]